MGPGAGSGGTGEGSGVGGTGDGSGTGGIGGTGDGSGMGSRISTAFHGGGCVGCTRVPPLLPSG